jgi:hypothetical protein
VGHDLDRDGNLVLVTVTLADGSYTLTATSSDPLGNASPPSAPFALVIDTTAPGPPPCSSGIDARVAAANANAPGDLSGTAESGGALVTIYSGATVVDTTFADNAGNWSASQVFTVRRVHVDRDGDGCGWIRTCRRPRPPSRW